MAVAYLPLAEAQRLADRPSQVNDLVLRLAPGTDRDRVEEQLGRAVVDLGISAEVTSQNEVYAFQALHDDIDNDHRMWDGLSALILVAVALAAFNLVSRIVEAQRREIGIGMALGTLSWRLGMRPVLIGLQVAIQGAVLGVGVGLLVGQAMAALLRSLLPMAIYLTPFQVGSFAQAAALGLLTPLVAALIPVWRADRVEPIEAIRTGHLTARANRLTDWPAGSGSPGPASASCRSATSYAIPGARPGRR